VLTVSTDRWSLKDHARQRNRVLASIDRSTLRPVSAADMDRRRAITRRMARKGMVNAAVGELRAVAYECAVVFPFAALATVAWFACNIP
jgi:hypothetical protein